MSEEKAITVKQESALTPKTGINYLQAWDFIEKSSEMLSKSRAIGMTPEQAALAMLTGYELGLSFTGALRVLYVAQSGQITLKPKGALSLMRSSGLLEKFDYSGDDTQQTVIIKRRGQPERKMSLTIEQAEKAGWKSKAWTATPSNMLRWRLIGWLADLEFTDITLGMPIADDSWMNVEITPDGEVIDITPEPVTKAQFVTTDNEGKEIGINNKPIPDYGYTLQTLIEAATTDVVLDINYGEFPETPEEINIVAHYLITSGKIEGF